MTNSEQLEIYKLNLKIEKLKTLLNRLNTQVEIYIQDINRKNELMKIVSNSKKRNELDKEISDTKKELEKTRLKYSRLEMVIKQKETKLKILHTNELLKNDELALVNSMDTLEGKYDVYKATDEKRIGFITFFPDSYESDMGSIGYCVLPNYRGNGYAYKALKLLTSYLSEKGVDKVSIVAEEKNIGSIKTMEKFKNDAYEYEDQTGNMELIKKFSYTLNKKEMI